MGRWGAPCRFGEGILGLICGMLGMLLLVQWHVTGCKFYKSSSTLVVFEVTGFLSAHLLASHEALS